MPSWQTGGAHLQTATLKLWSPNASHQNDVPQRDSSRRRRRHKGGKRSAPADMRPRHHHHSNAMAPVSDGDQEMSPPRERGALYAGGFPGDGTVRRDLRHRHHARGRDWHRPQAAGRSRACSQTFAELTSRLLRRRRACADRPTGLELSQSARARPSVNQRQASPPTSNASAPRATVLAPLIGPGSRPEANPGGWRIARSARGY